MSIHRFFRRRFPLRSRARELAFLCFILLMYGCGDETINPPLGGTRETEDLVPVSSIYYPMTVGSRWVYRNPDGSEWSRQVAVSEVFDAERYHSFSYNPPMALDFIGPAEYITYTDRLVRPIKATDYTEAIWQIILDSGGKHRDGILKCIVNTTIGK